MQAGLEVLERDFDAMVIGNQGPHFSAGANLTVLLMAAQEANWGQIERYLKLFQTVTSEIRYAPKPVVAAPFGHTLEEAGPRLCCRANCTQASAELYMGLVETNVGLIPAAGGTTRMLARLGAGDAFDRISRARVSASAPDARRLGLITETAGITMNPERLLADAKAAALRQAETYVPVLPQEIEIGGEAVYAKLKLAAWQALQAGFSTEYDFVVAEKLAHVLSGGRLTGKQTVPEQYLLDLEREVFASLCGNEQTQARIEHMLRTGKPLKN